MVWLRRTVCPSVCGWKAVDIRDRIPDSRRNSFHTADVKQESRSDTMSAGRPWYFQTSHANILAKSDAVLPFVGSTMKWAILVNLSMTTHNWSHPSESGRSVMKSMAINCHGA